MLKFETNAKNIYVCPRPIMLSHENETYLPLKRPQYLLISLISLTSVDAYFYGSHTLHMLYIPVRLP